LQSQGNRTKYSVPDQNIIWKNFKFYLDLNTVHLEPIRQAQGRLCETQSTA